MKVFVLSKMEFDSLMRKNNLNDGNVESRDHVFLISIVDTENREGPFFKENHENVLNLRFDDVEHDMEVSPTQKENTRAFTKEQAKELLAGKPPRAKSDQKAAAAKK